MQKVLRFITASPCKAESGMVCELYDELIGG